MGTEGSMQRWDPQSYERHGAFVHELAGEILGWLGARAGERILDLGCGNGALLRRIAATGADVEGIDNSSAMVAAAHDSGLAAHLASAEELPYEAATFDAVFSNAALHWVRDQEAMLGEVRRVLRPGGRFVVEMGGLGNVAAIDVALRAVLGARGQAGLLDGVNYFPSEQAYRLRLERHGFAVERMERVARPTPLPAGGMEGWLKTFRRGVLEELAEAERGPVLAEAVALLKPALCDELGQWSADYVRLRFLARV